MPLQQHPFVFFVHFVAIHSNDLNSYVIESPSRMMKFDQFIAHVRRDYGYAGQVAHIETIPAQEAKFVADDYALHPAISDALKQQDIDQLYTHQGRCANSTETR